MRVGHSPLYYELLLILIHTLQNPSQVGNATLLEIFWGYLCCCDLNNTSYLMESYAKRSSIAQDMVEMIKYVLYVYVY